MPKPVIENITLITAKEWTTIPVEIYENPCDISKYDVDSTWDTPIKPNEQLSWYPTEGCLIYKDSEQSLSVNVKPEKTYTNDGYRRVTGRTKTGESICLVFMQSPAITESHSEAGTDMKGDSTTARGVTRPLKKRLVSSSSQPTDQGKEDTETEEQRNQREWREHRDREVARTRAANSGRGENSRS